MTSLRSSSLIASELVKPEGICCTTITPAFRFPGSLGTTDCNDLGPPVDEAITTKLLTSKEFGIDSNELKIHLNQKYISKGKEVKIITIRHIAEKISKKKGK
jgi:hypothetical protein